MHRILLLCGSLRRDSRNAKLLARFAEGAAPGIEPLFFDLANLPFYDRDLDQTPEEAPEAVRRFREALASAQVVVLSAPEIIHGMPGLLKNAIDWCASVGSWVGKPVVLFHVSAGDSAWVAEGLRHTLEVLEAQVTHQCALSTAAAAGPELAPHLEEAWAKVHAALGLPAT